MLSGVLIAIYPILELKSYPKSDLYVVLGVHTWADPEGGTEGLDPPPPVKNHKYVGFPSNTVPAI